MTPGDLTEPILRRLDELRNAGPTRSMLVGISGIDASGKGFVTARLADELRRKGLSVAVTNVDGWLNLPRERFGGPDQGRHFYENALRLDEMFEMLILPLRGNRSIELEADFAEETASEFRRHRYSFHEIDVILLEGIFLFQARYVGHFDLRVWIDCSFETALTRAVARSQEGLDPAATIHAYQRIYFPAQMIHFAADKPRTMADIVVDND